MHIFRDRESDRGFTARGSEILYGRYTTQYIGEQHIKHRADHQRPQDTDGHIPLRIFCFLGRWGNRVKTDVREENDSGRPQNTEYSAKVVCDALGSYIARGSRNEGSVIGRINEAPADGDYQDHDRDLQNDDETI